MRPLPNRWPAFPWVLMYLVVVALTPARLGQADELADSFSRLPFEHLLSRGDQLLRKRDFDGRLALQRLAETDTDGQTILKCLETIHLLRYRPGMFYVIRPLTLRITADIEFKVQEPLRKIIREMRTVPLEQLWSEYAQRVDKETYFASRSLRAAPLRSYARDLARATAQDAPPAVRSLCQEFLDAPAVPPDLVKP